MADRGESGPVNRSGHLISSGPLFTSLNTESEVIGVELFRFSHWRTALAQAVEIGKPNLQD